MENKKVKIAFFDTKPYDRRSFDQANEAYGYEIAYFDTRLSVNTKVYYTTPTKKMRAC
jgi:D-lactate dehydrogenase